MTAVIITNWHEGWPYFGYITLNSKYISDYAIKIILLFKHVIFECLSISIEVIQGHRTLNFRDRSLKREIFRKNLNEQKIEFKGCSIGNRPHRSRFLAWNLAETSPSGARGLFGQNLLPTKVRRIIYQTKALDTRKTKKLVVVKFDTNLLSKLTFFLNL